MRAKQVQISRLNKINPQMISIAIVLAALALFIITVISIIGLTDQQNRDLVDYEFRIILQGNGELLRTASNREFSQKISLSDQSFYLRILNTVSHGQFEAGSSLLKESQCVDERYFEFDLTFCRPRLIPWSFLKIVTTLFAMIMVISFVVLQRLNLNMVTSFQKLFQVAGIPHPSKLSFSGAWHVAAEMAERFQIFQDQAIEFERNKAVAGIAKQVAHDIRSPLSALNIVMHGLPGISEERQLLIRNAIQRINDIANDLLRKGKQLSASEVFAQESVDQVLVTSVSNQAHVILPFQVINSLVPEKQVEFQDRPDIKIEADLQVGSGDIYVKGNAAELGRVISNLVNNSVEAFGSNSGNVVIGLRGYREQILIIIKDNGKGIPAHILSQLGQEGGSYGKSSSSSGSGLGVFHAKKTIESWSGTLAIHSQEAIGTTVEIKLPRARGVG